MNIREWAYERKRESALCPFSINEQGRIESKEEETEKERERETEQGGILK